MPLTMRIPSILVAAIALLAPACLAQDRPTQILLFGFGGDRSINARVTAAVKAGLKQGGSVQVTEFRQDLPSLKRAMMERRVSRNDITSSDPAARLAVAKALEADYFLTGEAIKEPDAVLVTLFSTRSRTGAKVEFSSRAARPEGANASEESLILSASNTIVTQFMTQVLQTLPPAGPLITRLPDPPPPDKNAPSPPPGGGTAVKPDQPPAVTPGPVTPPPAPRNPDEDSAGFVAEAETLASRGDLAGAIQAMRSAINVSPRDPKLRMRLAEFYSQRGMSEQASKEIEAAVALGGDAPSNRMDLASQLLSSGKAQEAEALYRAVLKDSPGDVAARIGLGDALWARGKPNDAALEYTQASNEAKNDPVPLERLARLFASRGMLDESATALQGAATLRGRKPDDALDSEMYRRLMQSADSLCKLHLDELEQLNKSFSGGASTREEYRKGVKPVAGQIDDLMDFLSSLTPPTDMAKAHLHRSLAASLLGQAVAALDDWLVRGTATLKDDYERYLRQASDEIDAAAAETRRRS